MKNDTQNIEYFLYARKSSETEDRQVTSIESQISELQKLAKENNLKIIKTFSESKSAKAPGRPEFNKMMAEIEKGKAQGVLCWKINRLARNPIDGGIVSWALDREKIKHIQTYGRSYYPDDNVLVMSVEQGMASQFIKDLRIDTRRGLRQKIERGWYPAASPLGYTHNPEKRKGEKEIIIDKKRFSKTRKIFDLALSNKYSVAKILRIVNGDWKFKNQRGKEIGTNTLYKILTNPFYYGEFEYPKESGKWYKGKHTPMITKKEYDKIQTNLGRNDKPRPIVHQFPFTGMIRCAECGAMVTAETKIKKQKNGNVHTYTYYHCTKRLKKDCSQKSIEEKELERQIFVKLEQVAIPPEFKDWAMDLIKKAIKEESKDINKILADQQKRYKECIGQIDGLIKMRANEEINKEEFLSRKEILAKEKENLEELFGDSGQRVTDWINNVGEMLDFAERAKKEYKKADLFKKKEILLVLGSNLFLKNQELLVQSKKLLLSVKEVAPIANQIFERFEPVKNGLDKTKVRAAYSQNPILYRLGESNPYFQDENLMS